LADDLLTVTEQTFGGGAYHLSIFGDGIDKATEHPEPSPQRRCYCRRQQLVAQ
jgi:hypothetical protein